MAVIHLVEAGEVHLRRHQPDGAALVVQRTCRDDVLAEAFLFSTAYPCDAIAVVPTLTLAIAKPQLGAVMAQDPDLAEAWSAHLAHAVRRSRVAVAGAVFYPPFGAAARLLGPLDRRLGARTTAGAAFLVLTADKPR